MGVSTKVKEQAGMRSCWRSRSESARSTKRMKLSLALIVAMAAILGSGQKAAAQCMQGDKPGEIAQGALAQGMFRDAAGRPEQAFILTLAVPTCLSGAEESDNVKSTRTIHIFSSDDSVGRRIHRFVGSTVVVRGTAFGALTVHHHAPIVMDVSEIASASAQGASVATTNIVEPTGDPKPSYSKDREPTAQQLIETWRASNEFMPEKRVDKERFEILDRRVAWGKYGRAFLQFRILSPAGNAMTFASSRCPGRRKPVEIQIYYQFSDHLDAWVPQGRRGESSEGLCSNEKLWTSEQIEKLVNPPPLPIPPKVSQRDVYTPQPGSPERVAIMDALRPRYEEVFGKPIVFKVETLRVAAGFAFVVVHPQRPNGSPIEKRVWDRAFGGDCFQNRESVSHEYWMQKRGGVWRIGLKNNMCADDSIVDQGDLIGAPPQLIEKDEWPAREFMPEPE